MTQLPANLEFEIAKHKLLIEQANLEQMKELYLDLLKLHLSFKDVTTRLLK